VADSLNLPVEQITENDRAESGHERVQTEYLTVESGQAAGVPSDRSRPLERTARKLVYLELQMYVGAKDPADTITLTGHPNISLDYSGRSHGDIATTSVVVNSIPVILDAPAGDCARPAICPSASFAERASVKRNRRIETQKPGSRK